MVDIAEVITINSPIGDMPFTVDSVQKLCDEIERLREALKKIDLATSIYAQKNIPEVVSNIARAALKETMK